VSNPQVRSAYLIASGDGGPTKTTVNRWAKGVPGAPGPLKLLLGHQSTTSRDEWLATLLDVGSAERCTPLLQLSALRIFVATIAHTPISSLQIL
jgi:hypothetical protein